MAFCCTVQRSSVLVVKRPEVLCCRQRSFSSFQNLHRTSSLLLKHPVSNKQSTRESRSFLVLWSESCLRIEQGRAQTNTPLSSACLWQACRLTWRRRSPSSPRLWTGLGCLSSLRPWPVPAGPWSTSWPSLPTRGRTLSLFFPGIRQQKPTTRRPHTPSRGAPAAAKARQGGERARR